MYICVRYKVRTLTVLDSNTFSFGMRSSHRVEAVKSERLAIFDSVKNSIFIRWRVPRSVSESHPFANEKSTGTTRRPQPFPIEPSSMGEGRGIPGQPDADDATLTTRGDRRKNIISPRFSFICERVLQVNILFSVRHTSHINICFVIDTPRERKLREAMYIYVNT